MENPYMYLLVFKKPSKSQVEIIRNTFSDFDWSQGFDVEEIVANDIVNDNLIIQFVSFKEFFQNNGNEITLYPQTVEAVLSGKGQFFGTLFDSGKGVEELDTYFCYLGEASEIRDLEHELYFKVDFGRYSSLTKVDTSLEKLMA
jgi:hypothetical protein